MPVMVGRVALRAGEMLSHMKRRARSDAPHRRFTTVHEELA